MGILDTHINDMGEQSGEVKCRGKGQGKKDYMGGGGLRTES